MGNLKILRKKKGGTNKRFKRRVRLKESITIGNEKGRQVAADFWLLGQLRDFSNVARGTHSEYSLLFSANIPSSFLTFLSFSSIDCLPSLLLSFLSILQKFNGTASRPPSHCSYCYLFIFSYCQTRCNGYGWCRLFSRFTGFCDSEC